MWKIFYGDGSTFSSTDGDLTDAPSTNVQIIVQENESTGHYNQSGSDYYIWRDDHWWGVDIFGLFDFLMESGLVKFGRTIESSKFTKVYRQAKDDPDFPPRSAYLPKERKL
jgi:hypothetical protein